MLNNGKFPLKFKIARKGSAIYIPAGYELKEEEWDKDNERVKNLPDRRLININLGKRLANINDKISDLQDKGILRQFSNKRLVAFLTNEEDEGKERLFCKIMKEYIERANGEGTKKIFIVTENKIKEFCDYKNLEVEDIDIEWLDKFSEHLKVSEKNSKNTIALRLRSIRTIINIARKRGFIDRYVFDSYKISTEETAKRSLSVEELRNLHDAKLSKIRSRNRDIFFLIFYLMGINLIDLSRIESVQDERIKYRRAKTGTLYDIKVEPEALEIIEKYRGKKHLINIFDKGTGWKSIDGALNKNLKEICSSIGIPIVTTYWARHTFATIAYEIGISIDIIADCLGHKSGHRVTQIYIKKDQKKVDEANRRVIDYVLYGKI